MQQQSSYIYFVLSLFSVVFFLFWICQPYAVARDFDTVAPAILFSLSRFILRGTFFLLLSTCSSRVCIVARSRVCACLPALFQALVVPLCSAPLPWLQTRERRALSFFFARRFYKRRGYICAYMFLRTRCFRSMRACVYYTCAFEGGEMMVWNWTMRRVWCFVEE